MGRGEGQERWVGERGRKEKSRKEKRNDRILYTNNKSLLPITTIMIGEGGRKERAYCMDYLHSSLQVQLETGRLVQN